MFSPGFAQIGRLLEGETVARKSGVRVGDCIVAVNGSGYRRFAADVKEEELENLSGDDHMSNDNNVFSAGTGEGMSNDYGVNLYTSVQFLTKAFLQPILHCWQRLNSSNLWVIHH